MRVLRGRNALAEPLREADADRPSGDVRVVSPTRPTSGEATPSRRARVMHVLAPAREGGLEQVVAMLASGRGPGAVHVVAVVSPGDADRHPFIDRLLTLGIPVTRLVVRGRAYIGEYRNLRVLVDDLRPTIVHTHGYRADILAGAAARACGVPTISTVHGFTGGGARNRLYERMQCFALRRADAVIAVSKPLVSRLTASGIFPGRVHYIQNGFRPATTLFAREEARVVLGLPQDCRVIGWIGRLSREKGPDVMVEALARCDSAWRLSVLGTGRERDRLTALAHRLGVADRISWHGSIPDAASLLKAFDAFVLSSRTEGTPISLLEAMHAEIPLLATSVGGVPDVVTAGEAILVESDSPAAIAEGLAEIIRDPAAAARRAVSARDRVARAFGSASWFAAVDEIYDATHA